MVYYETAHRLRDMLAEGDISSEEIVQVYFKRIEELEENIGAYISLERARALEKAREVDRERKTGRYTASFAGLPMAVKDNICTEGLRTTCASKMLEDFVPSYSATAYKRMMRTACILMGKTNMDEFGMGSSTENSAFKITRNPWDLRRTPGGSSGGSAAAVAAGMTAFALASDTGGSIRQPAALCGVVGIKPTYGRVPRYGLIALASSLEQIGPITRDVRDGAELLNIICGHDRRDSTSACTEVPDFTANLGQDIKGMRIGIPTEYFQGNIDEGVRDSVKESIKVLEDLGALCDEVSLPHTEYAVAAYYVISAAEASSNLARYDGIRFGYRAKEYTDLDDMYIKTRSEGFGTEVKRRILLGTYVLSSDNYDTYYKKSLKVRRLVKDDFDKIFKDYDIIAGPTLPMTAFAIGEKDRDPSLMYKTDLYTVSANLAGLPALSVPCGFSKGLPVGLQLIGKPFAEDTLLRAAYAYEESTKFYENKPHIKGGARDEV